MGRKQERNFSKKNIKNFLAVQQHLEMINENDLKSDMVKRCRKKHS